MTDLAKLLPEEIYERSFAIIKEGLGNTSWGDAEYRIVQRLVHTVGDLNFAELVRIHPEAVSRGIAALRNDVPVICDSRMLEAGMTRLRGRVRCATNVSSISRKGSPPKWSPWRWVRQIRVTWLGETPAWSICRWVPSPGSKRMPRTKDEPGVTANITSMRFSWTTRSSFFRR